MVFDKADGPERPTLTDFLLLSEAEILFILHLLLILIDLLAIFMQYS